MAGIKPLTLKQFKQKDDQKVYVCFGDGLEGYVTAKWQGRNTVYLDGNNKVSDDHFEPDLDFYGMFYDDPDGHFGLHLLGWVAYSKKPKEESKDA